MSAATITLTVALAALVLWSPPAAAQNPHVYQVSVEDKHAGISRVLTGFRMRGQRGIVTALHGVADAGAHTDIRVYPAANAPKFPGTFRIARVDVDHDAALLVPSTSATIPDEGFDLDSTRNWEHLKHVQVIGYPYNSSNQNLKERALADIPRQTLQQLPLPPEDIIALNQRSSPNPTITVIYINDVVLPGESGAPVLDDEGRVVGIANGGLGGGTVNICWAIPCSELHWVNVDAEPRLKTLRSQSPELLFDFDSERTPKLRPERSQLEKQYALEYTEKTYLDRAARGETKVVRLFLDAGIYPDAQDDDGVTALMLAADNGRLDVVRELLAYEVDVDRHDRYGRTALMLARRHGYHAIEDTLLRVGADPSGGVPPVSAWIISARGTIQGSGSYPLGGDIACLYNIIDAGDVPISVGIGVAAKRYFTPIAYAMPLFPDSGRYSVTYGNFWASIVLEGTVMRFGNGGDISIGGSAGVSPISHTSDTRFEAFAALRWPITYWWSVGLTVGATRENLVIDVPGFSLWGDPALHPATFGRTLPIAGATISFNIR